MTQQQPIILKEIKTCPQCGGTDTFSHKACVGTKFEHIFTSLEKFVTPIEEPVLAALTFKAILTHFDCCYTCGTKYATRMEIIAVPVTVQQFPSKNPPFPRMR